MSKKILQFPTVSTSTVASSIKGLPTLFGVAVVHTCVGCFVGSLSLAGVGAVLGLLGGTFICGPLTYPCTIEKSLDISREFASFGAKWGSKIGADLGALGGFCIGIHDGWIDAYGSDTDALDQQMPAGTGNFDA